MNTSPAEPDRLSELQDIFRPGWVVTGAPSQCGAGSFGDYGDSWAKLTQECIDLLGVKSVIDVGCGDCHWIEPLIPQLKSYTGYDILQWDRWRGLLDRHLNVTLYKDYDISRQVPVKADLCICICVFIHLPNSYVLEALDCVRRSGTAHILINSQPTNTMEDNLQRDIDLNHKPHRRSSLLNFELPPFNLELVQGQHLFKL